MRLSRKILIVAGMVILAIALALTMAAVAHHFLPVYLENKLTEKMSAFTGLPVSIKVRRIGLYGADLGDIRIGSEKNPTLIIPSLRVDYHATGLYRERRIDRVIIDGAALFTELIGDRLRPANMPMTGRRPGLSPHEQQTDGFELPVSIGSLAMRGTMWMSGYGPGKEQLPLELLLSDIGKDLSKARLAAAFYPRGQRIAVEVGPGDGRNRVTVDVNTRDLAMAAFSDLLEETAVQQLDGRLTLKAHLEISLFPFKIGSVAARGSITGASLKVEDFVVQTKGADSPFVLKVDTTKRGGWKITGSSLALSEPVRTAVDRFSIIVASSQEGLEGSGTIQLAWEPGQWDQGPETAGKAASAAQVFLDVNGRYLKDETWQIGIATVSEEKHGQKKMAVRRHGVGLYFQPPQITLSGRGRGGAGSLAVKVDLPSLEVSSGALKGTSSGMLFKGQTDFSFKAPILLKGSGELIFSRLKLSSGLSVLSVEKTRLNGDFQLSRIDGFAADGGLTVSGGRVRLPGHKLRLGTISARMPLLWPARRKGRAGTFSMGSIVRGGKNLGTVKGVVSQTLSGLRFHGTHTSRILSRLSVSYGGNLDLYNVPRRTLLVHLDLDRPDSAPEADIADLVPGIEKLFISGGLSLNGDFLLENTGMRGHLAAAWENGQLRMPEKKITIEGISAFLRFPDLPQLRSAPRQMVSFSRAAAGDLEVKNGEIEFQLESFRSLLIEKSRFQWSQGVVEVPAFRIAPDTDEYLLTLYCDRLNLAEILDQLGIAAEGKGTLNGRIPVRYTKGRISFKDGFLFSTPGEGGKVRITQSDILTAGVLPQSPEYAQMALASEALKDYDYSWAKLNLNTEGEDLLIRLQLDGKPAGVLPFVYRKEKGSFVRSGAGGQGSRFQGIRLDVNFRLPLNRLLRYTDIVPMMK